MVRLPGPIIARALAAALVVCAPRGPALTFDTAHGPVRVNVEIVDTPEARERGLMGRTSLDDDAGMLFVWDADASSAFWMKDTLIPLSVAFIAADGTVLRILDMDPCRADPCPVYDPRTSYRMALEAKQGAFAKWSVAPGDHARLVR